MQAPFPQEEVMMGMSMSLGQEYRMELRRAGFSTCLPKLEDLIAHTGGESLQIFHRVQKRKDYRSNEDYLLAVFVPQLRRHIKAYYRKCGPLMVDQFKKAFLQELDQKLCVGFGAATRVWSLMKDEADRSGISRRQVLEEIRITIAAQQLPEMDLEPHYLEPGGGLRRLKK